MKIEGWKYYNHAVIPTTAPHEKVNMTPLHDGQIWKIGGGTPIIARWTSDFDCGYETNWWYVIKDSNFDINRLKAKRRYEINKGKKNFTVKEIIAAEYGSELYEITIQAFSGWPEKYRPMVDEKAFRESVANWNEKYVVLGGFSNEENQLMGYALLTETVRHAEFNVLRVIPEAEKKGLNAAMVAGIMEKYDDRLGRGFYVNDGSRSIRHETAFQDYLEKYFEFRKAYCKLNIKYRFPIGLVINVVYPFRNKINRDSKLGSLTSSILKMEEIRRSCQ